MSPGWSFLEQRQGWNKKQNKQKNTNNENSQSPWPNFKDQFPRNMLLCGDLKVLMRVRSG